MHVRVLLVLVSAIFFTEAWLDILVAWLMFNTYWLWMMTSVLFCKGHYQTLLYSRQTLALPSDSMLCLMWTEWNLVCAALIRRKILFSGSHSLSGTMATVCFVPLTYDSAWQWIRTLRAIAYYYINGPAYVLWSVTDVHWGMVCCVRPWTVISVWEPLCVSWTCTRRWFTGATLPCWL